LQIQVDVMAGVIPPEVGTLRLPEYIGDSTFDVQEEMRAINNRAYLEALKYQVMIYHRDEDAGKAKLARIVTLAKVKVHNILEKEVGSETRARLLGTCNQQIEGCIRELWLNSSIATLEGNIELNIT